MYGYQQVVIITRNAAHINPTNSPSDNNPAMTSRRRHNNRVVIHRTTTETIRISESSDVTLRPTNLPSLHIKKPVSSTSFVVTGVSSRVDGTTCDFHSPDDSEEISKDHTDIDIDTPSFSEDTSYSQYTEDVDVDCACDKLILKRCVNAVITSNEDNLAQTPPQKLTEKIDNGSQQPSSAIKIVTKSLSSDHTPSPGRFIGRFQVVKVESIHPFRRGRWICHDYVDNSEYAPKDGYQFFEGKFVKRNDLGRIENATFIFKTFIDETSESQTMNQTLALVRENTSQLVFMNAPMLPSTYPIIRTENTAVQSFHTQKIVSTTPRPILRSVPLAARAQ